MDAQIVLKQIQISKNHMELQYVLNVQESVQISGFDQIANQSKRRINNSDVKRQLRKVLLMYNWKSQVFHLLSSTMVNKYLHLVYYVPGWHCEKICILLKGYCIEVQKIAKYRQHIILWLVNAIITGQNSSTGISYIT